jgi:galactose-1-phosphate uridylyltransferase
LPEIRKDYFENDYVITTESVNRNSVVDGYKTNGSNKKNCIICNIKKSKGKQKHKTFEIIEPMLKKLNYSLHIENKNHLIIYDSDHKDKLHTNSVKQFTALLGILRQTLGELSTNSNSEYVSLCYNSGITSSIDTSHSRFELITYDNVPPIIDVESNNFLTSIEDLGICPMCRIVNVELGGLRQVLSTSNFISFIPWAPKVDFEQLIFPKKHQFSFIETDEKDLSDLSLLMRSVIGGMFSILNIFDFSLYFHNSPSLNNKGKIHWHIEIVPHLRYNSALETDLSIYVNKNSPESCAKLLSKASRSELAKLVGI